MTVAAWLCVCLATIAGIAALCTGTLPGVIAGLSLLTYAAASTVALLDPSSLSQWFL